MADLSISSDTSAQAYDIAQQNASDARAKSGQYVKGDAYRIAQLSKTGATAAVAPTDSVGGMPGLQSKAVTNTDAPELPSPTGATATPAQTMRVVKGSEVFAAGGDGVFAALEAMSDARQKDVNDAMLVKRLQGANQLNAKEQGVSDKEDEIKGNEIAAGVKLAGSMAGLGLSFGLTMKGSRDVSAGGVSYRPTTSRADDVPAANSTAAADSAASVADKNIRKEQNKQQQELAGSDVSTGKPNATAPTAAEEEAKLPSSTRSEADGAMYRNLGMNIPSSVDAAVNMVDMDAGGQAMSNAAQLAQKQDDVQAQIAQTKVDGASSWLDAAKDQRKAAQQAIQTHVQMWGDSVNSVWK